ncbi:nephrocystin-4, partial [Bombina bombina]|uniref:nephrocystin-4 n=1 Tax=Bombina bombina TaxID=8345 RepID=UPI00235B0B67
MDFLKSVIETKMQKQAVICAAGVFSLPNSFLLNSNTLKLDLHNLWCVGVAQELIRQHKYPTGMKGLPDSEGRVCEQRLKRSVSLPASKSRIISAHNSRSSFRGGSLFSSSTLGGGKNISQAQKLADLDSELAAMLFSRMKDVSIAYQHTNSETDATQRRKKERMMAVRQHESQENSNLRKSLRLAQHEERTQHTRDLQIIEAYRERTKAESISSMLNQAITSNYTVYATLGTAEFFEFELKNPYNTQYTVSIEIDSSDLSVIVDTREWKHFKELTNTLTPIEENMFHMQENTPQLYLRPKETVYIPFKYQTFTVDYMTILQ